MSEENRKVIADNDYQPGEVIVPAECPILHVLHQEFKFVHCDECFSKSKALKRCGGCRQMAYCSRSCQVKNWKDAHKSECPIFKAPVAAADFFGPFGDKIRFILRAWVLYKDASSKLHTTEATLPTDKNRRFANLMANVDIFQENDLMTGYFNDELIPLFKRHNLITDDEQDNLFRVWCKLRTNGYGISPLFGDQQEELGAGLYLACSAFNHSCRPNASQIDTSNGVPMKVIAILPIKRGEEICISYIDIFQSTAERRAQLERIYSFTCQCEYCTTTAASQKLTNQENNQLLEMEGNAQLLNALEMKKMMGEEGLDRQILQLKIARYELVARSVPTSDPALIAGMPQICQAIVQRTLRSVTSLIMNQGNKSAVKRLRAELAGDVQQSRWTDDEWLSQTERHLAMIVEPDHPVVEQFKKMLGMYNEAKEMCKKLIGVTRK